MVGAAPPFFPPGTSAPSPESSRSTASPPWRTSADDIFNYIVADYGAPDADWLQEDMAPCHASKRSKAAKSALRLKPLPWMGQSHDLNPIENAWNELDRRLRSRTTSPKNLDELWEALCEEWDAIPTAFFDSLIQSMPRRVNAVIASKGAGTKY